MRPTVIVVMGVCGVGKTSIAQETACQMEARYVEADDFHPAGNVDSMRQGKPLTDAMRRPWLEGLGEALAESRRRHPDQTVIAACSALKLSYRDILRAHVPDTFFVYLHGDRALIGQRMAARTDHFMPLTLLDSQLATLEPPRPEETFGAVDVSGTKQETTQKVLELLKREELRA